VFLNYNNMPLKPKADASPKADRPKREAKKKEEPQKEPEKAAPEADGPKKVKKPKKAAGERKKKSHPPYKRMIFRAIKDLDEKGGSSPYAIAKYIKAKYSVPETYKRYLKHALRRELENKNLIKFKASYKLSAKFMKRGERKKRKKSKSRAKSAEAKSPEKKEKKARKEKKSPEKKKRAKKAEDKKERKSPEKKKESSAKEGKAEEAVKSAKKARGGSAAMPAKVKAVGSKYDHVWQYEDNGGVWKNYEIAASDTCEEVYQGYLANKGDTDVRAVKSGEWEYQVDFMAMKQTNIQHPNHKVRSLRRLPIAK